MPYKKPTLWDYLKLCWHMIGWRFWRAREQDGARKRPCGECKWLGNLPRGRCDVCGPPAWDCYEWDYTEGCE